MSACIVPLLLPSLLVLLQEDIFSLVSPHLKQLFDAAIHAPIGFFDTIPVACLPSAFSKTISACGRYDVGKWYFE
jgi:hypothetical protein